MKKYKWFWILGIILLVSGGYYAYVEVDKHWSKYDTLEGNNQILKNNQKLLEEQLKNYAKRKQQIEKERDSLKAQIDSLKALRPILQREKQKSRAVLENMPKSNWQKWYDNKIKQLQK